MESRQKSARAHGDQQTYNKKKYYAVVTNTKWKTRFQLYNYPIRADPGL